MGLCTIHAKPLRGRDTFLIGPSAEKKKEENRLFWWFITFWFGTFARLFRAI